jgi:CheY-like chemotaxis protein
MKILLVDDDAMAAEMTAAILEEAGHILVMAQDAADAVAQFDANPDVDMVISDMNMPLLSGIDLFRQLREQGQNLPFVLLTGDAAGPLLAEEPRLDACLVKDFSLEETLAPAIEAVMQARKAL